MIDEKFNKLYDYLSNNTNPNILSLDLSSNYIKEKGLQYLSRSLPFLPKLKEYLIII